MLGKTFLGRLPFLNYIIWLVRLHCCEYPYVVQNYDDSVEADEFKYPYIYARLRMADSTCCYTSICKLEHDGLCA